MEKNDEKNELEPTGESNNSQETDEGGDTKNNSDSSSDSSEQGNENLSSESSSTVLVSENGVEEGENIQTGDQDREGIDQDELERAIEKELEEGVEIIYKYLDEESEFIKAYQEMVGKERAIDEVREREGEGCKMTDEEWEKEVETAAYNAEVIYESMEGIETNTIKEEISEIKEELEIEKEVEQSEEISKLQLSDLKEEVREQEQELEQIYEGREPLEQHQVEPFIKEALETEQENITKEKELEQYQELNLKEQFQTVHFNEFIEELVEKQEEETEQLKEQEEKEELEAQASKIKEANSELYEEVEVERDALDQHEVEPAIQEELETVPESIFNEKEIEKLQELDIEKQFQTVHFNEFIEELVEKQEEYKNNENDKIEQEKENIEQTQEVIHQLTYLQKKIEEQEHKLELEYEEKDGVEQHQVEDAIEEELKTEPKPIINEEELEYIKYLEPEKKLEAELFYEFIEELANKQNEVKEEREENEEQEEISTEQKVAQIKRELDISQEISSGETEVELNSQEGELEQETTSLDEEVVEQLEIEENKDHQQELEEILEQVRKIEQEALNEIEREEEDSNKTAEKKNERAKSLYKQQTGKRPIYANKETKGFKQWLEQKKEEDWKTTFKEWIEEASEEEYNAEFKSELKKALKSYDEFEDLTRKHLELYDKPQNEKLTEKEKKRLKSLRERLQELDPIKLELLKSVFFIKKHIAEQYCDDFWNWPLVNRVLSKFFKHISQKIIKLKKAQENKENLEEIIRNWIEQASEGEISPELKVKLKEIVENYSELEELATMFMKLYTKEQREKLSKHEKHELRVLTKTLQKLESGKIELFANIRAIKHFLNDQNFDEFSDKARVNRILSHFFKHISQKIIKLKELINPNEKLKLKKCQLIENQECDHSLDLVKQQNSLKNIKKKQNLGKVIHSYPDIEVNNIWKPLFEKLGNFKNVAKELNELYEKTERKIWPKTVSNRIQKLFKNKKKYIIWYNKHAKQKIYPEDDVIKIWKPLFEKLGTFNAVKRELSKNYHGIPPMIETIISKLQKLFKDHPEHFKEKTHFDWFLKYTKQYHDGIVKNWIKLFEEFGSYRLVRHNLKSQNGGIPSESTIRRRVKIYFEINGLDYFTWINQYGSASHYSSNEILIWKHLFEEIGTYRGVALRFEQIDGRLPSHKNIKLRLKNFFLSEQQNFKEYSFEEWEGKFGRYFHINPILERWIDLFKRYGSFYSVYKIEKSNPNIYYKLPTSVETIIKQVQNYLKDDFDTFYKKFHNPTSIPLIREKIINDLHKNPPKSLESIAIKLSTTRKTVTKYAHEEFDPIKYEERWYNEIPQSIEQSIIEDILNSQLTLRRIAEKWDVSRTPITRLAKKICPNFRERFPLIGYLLLGTLFHLCINSILTDFFTSKRIKYFSEVPIFPPSWKRADGFLFNDNEYINNLMLNFGLKNVIGVQFEFTFDLSEENLLEKILKYQHPNILLLIVGTNWDYSGGIQYHLKLKNANILYPQNIKIINPHSFAKIIQLKDRFQDKFRELLEFNNIKNLDNLKSIVNLDIIETNKMYELEEYLKELGYSIESFFGISRKT